MQTLPPSHSHLPLLDPDREVFVGTPFRPPDARMQHWPMHRWPAALTRSSRSGHTAQRDVFAQPADERVVLGRRSKLLDSGNAGIHTKQAFIDAFGQVTEEGGDRLLAALSEPSAADQADPHAADQHHARQRRDEIGVYGSLCPLPVAFAEDGAHFARAQPRDRGRIDGMHSAPLTAQVDRFDWQVGQAPGDGTIKQRIECERAARQGPFNAMPAPAQVRDIRQRGAGTASLALEELAGEQGDEYNTDEPELHGRNALGRYRMK
jgi:hypothetical protein